MAVAIVVALYVFVGNSGVLSFGHISFVAVGAWTAGVLSVPEEEKTGDPAEPVPASCATRRSGNVPSLLVAALVGGVYALVVGLPLMRLSGLAAGIATFAVLEITHNVLRYYEKIGPGATAFSLRARDDGPAAGLARGAGRDRCRIRLPTQPPRAAAARHARGFGRGASRRRLGLPPAAVGVRALGCARRASQAASTSICLPLTTEEVYLDLTFITLAMLVIGGATSLWGAVVGALAISGLDSFLAEAEVGTRLAIDLPAGTRDRGRRRADGARSDPSSERAHRRAGAVASRGPDVPRSRPQEGLPT